MQVGERLQGCLSASRPSSCRDAQMLMEDVKRIGHELEQGQQLSSIGVELVDNELAMLYMNSKKSEVSPRLGAAKGKSPSPASSL